MTTAASPLDRLREWTDDRSKEFEVIAQKRDTDAPVADRALEIVRQFIIERKLILYGGQAIDFALRLKGSGIYPEHQTPDYDFFSPQSVDDAYDLADRLVAAGFSNVGAIPAIHVQTMRVATDFIYVADISYAPPEVYDSLPTVSYAGMRVLHPDYQRTDMHLAFCFPFNNPPREDIFHRYFKDLKRFRLFQEFYPITTGAALASGGAAAPTPAGVEVDLSRVAVHGFAAYALIRKAFDELEGAAKEAGVGGPALARAREFFGKTPELKIELAKGASGRTLVRFSPPAASTRLALATPWPDEVAASLAADLKASVEWFAPYMDSRPLMARISGSGAKGGPEVDVYSTHNHLLAVSSITSGDATVTVATPQYVLLNFLYEAHVAEDPALRDLYVQYYTATLDLIEAGGVLIAALRDEGSGPAVSEDVYRAFVESSPFGLPVRTIGDANYDSSYLIRLAQSALKVGDEPPGIDPADLPDLANVPTRYYPGGKHTPGEHPPFDYGSNVAFQRAGQPIAPRTIEGGGAQGHQRRDPGAMASRTAPRRGAKPTYLPMLAELDRRELDKILRAEGWHSVSLQQARRSAYVDFIVVDGRYNSDRRLWEIQCGVKGRLGVPVLTNKVNLHEALTKEAPELIRETVVVQAPSGDAGGASAVAAAETKAPEIPGDGVWIWRPELGFSGRGVRVFDSQEALDKIWEHHLRDFPQERALISRYIEDPVLIDVDGQPHKMHLRLYLLVVAIPEGTIAPAGRRAALFREGEIANAAKPYEKGAYSDFDVHDTHFGKSKEHRFPNDYPGGVEAAVSVFNQARSMLAAITKAYLPTAKPFPECQGGFEILGVDLMVDSSGRAWLIEINDRVGYKTPHKDAGSDHDRWLSEFLFRGVTQFVLGIDSPGPSPLVPCVELPY